MDKVTISEDKYASMIGNALMLELIANIVEDEYHDSIKIHIIKSLLKEKKERLG